MWKTKKKFFVRNSSSKRTKTCVIKWNRMTTEKEGEYVMSPARLSTQEVFPLFQSGRASWKTLYFVSWRIYRCIRIYFVSQFAQGKATSYIISMNSSNWIALMSLLQFNEFLLWTCMYLFLPRLVCLSLYPKPSWCVCCAPLLDGITCWWERLGAP